MTRPAGTCPNCGAKIEFLWSSSVQTVCTYCRSILVRTDVDLTRVGEVADLPPDSSPIQIGTDGVFRDQPFTVTGRIVYEWEQGGWNEWHLALRGGSSGWLSDAQAEYAISFPCTTVTGLPAAEQVRRGQRYEWQGTFYEVTTVTQAHYRGVEGELPFEYWDKADVLFVDLRSSNGRFATLDYSDPQPLLFLGEAVEFNDLRLKNLRRLEGW